jgi:hypothetical protein
VRTITEISKYKFLDMLAFCNAYKKVYGEVPDANFLSNEFGRSRAALFANLVLALDTGKINMEKFIRATLRDDGMIEFKHYHK